MLLLKIIWLYVFWTQLNNSNLANVIFEKSQSFFWISHHLFLSSHYVVHLICVSAYFMESLIYSFKCLLLHCWVKVNKSEKQFLWLQKINMSSEIQIEQKKKLRYSEESPWFPEYYIGEIGIGNCDQETSNIYYEMNKLFKR